jgi:hypothetical protein
MSSKIFAYNLKTGVNVVCLNTYDLYKVVHDKMNKKQVFLNMLTFEITSDRLDNAQLLRDGVVL